jgi:hypothetical protein
MKRIFTSLVVAGLLVLASAGLSVHTPTTKAATPQLASVRSGACSLKRLAGHWGHSYSGTIVGFGPAVAVGSTIVNADGSFSGSQTRSFNGDVEAETLDGTITANSDCTGVVTANVYLNGALERTTTLNIVWVNDGKNAKAIFDTPSTAIIVDYAKIDE